MSEPSQNAHSRLVRALGGLGTKRPVEVGAGDRSVRTERMTLRLLKPSDRAPFIEAVRVSAADVAPWTPLHEEGADDDALFERQLAVAAQSDASKSAWRRVGVLSDGTIVGAFHLNAITRGLDWHADATWWVRSDFTRQGYASEGIRAMLAHAFSPMPEGLGLFAVHCGIDPRNEPSRRCAEACGFVHDPGQRSYLKLGTQWAVHEFYMARPGDAA